MPVSFLCLSTLPLYGENGSSHLFIWLLLLGDSVPGTGSVGGAGHEDSALIIRPSSGVYCLLGRSQADVCKENKKLSLNLPLRSVGDLRGAASCCWMCELPDGWGHGGPQAVVTE